MQSLIPLIIIGFFVYLIFFSRKGGIGTIGCCGGHGAYGGHSSDKEKKVNTEPVSQMQDERVIDLRKGIDYVLLPVEDDEPR